MRLHGGSQRRGTTGLVLVVGSALLLALHVFLVRDVSVPSVVPDEAGYLGNARWLSGTSPTWIMGEAPYYGFGYSLVLAPLFAVFHDPYTLYRAVIVVNALLVTSLFPLLYVFCRRLLGATERVALVAALVGALVPAATAYTAVALAEVAVLPLLVAAALTCRAALRAERAGWFFPVVVALLLATHSRFTLIVPLAALVLLVAGWTRLLPVRRWAGQLLALGVLSVAVVVVRRTLLDRRWTSRAAPEGTLGDLYRTLSSLGGLNRFAAGVVGQGWYMAAGSLALAVIGAVVLVTRLRPAPTSVRRLRVWLADADRLAVGFLVLATASVFALSVAFFSRHVYRGEFFIYGRHNEGFMPLLVAAGAAFIIGPARRSLRVGAAVAAAVGTALFGVMLAVHLRDGELQRNVIHLSIPAVGRFTGPSLLLHASGAAVLAMAALAALTAVGTSRRWRSLFLVVMAGWFVFMSLGAIKAATDEEQIVFDRWDVPAQLRDLGVDTIAVVEPVPALALQNYQWSSPDVRFEHWPLGRTTLPRTPFVLASARSPQLAQAGARIAMLDTGGWYPYIGAGDGLALWVQPGPEQDRLAARGELLPAGFPGPLPEDSQRARLKVPASAPVRVRPGGGWTTTVDVEHLGRSSPWPDNDSYDQPGRVQVVGRMIPRDRSTSAAEPLPTFRAELPEWSRPGERFTVDLPAVAVDGRLRPLPPGSYDLRIGLAQDGFGDFDTDAAEPVDVEVTVR